MRRTKSGIRRWVAAAGVIAAVVVVAGPRTPTRTEVRAPSLPQDLDAYLAAAEGRYPDLTPGTEKRIRWADSIHPQPTELSVVYLHGFSATRQETHPLTERVAAGLAANAFETRLRGHGRPGEALATASLADWVDDAAEALEIGRRLGDRMVLMGTSTGATLALWVAAQNRWRDDLAALVLLSPNFEPADPAAAVLTWPWGGLLARLAVGPYREWEAHNPMQERYWTTRYPVEALLPMAGLVKATRRLDLGAVSTPTLVLYSSLDQVVSVDAIHEAVSGLPAERTEVLDVGMVGDPDNHVIAGDVLSPESTDRLAAEILDFLARAAR